VGIVECSGGNCNGDKQNIAAILQSSASAHQNKLIFLRFMPVQENAWRVKEIELPALPNMVKVLMEDEDNRP